MSDKTKHTPGPWLYREKNCAVYTASSTHPYGQFIFGFDQDDPPEEADANLVIAAPDLLEALQEMVAGDAEAIEEAQALGVPFPEEMLATFKKARAAIAKATGEPA